MILINNGLERPCLNLSQQCFRRIFAVFFPLHIGRRNTQHILLRCITLRFTTIAEKYAVARLTVGEFLAVHKIFHLAPVIAALNAYFGAVKVVADVHVDKAGLSAATHGKARGAAGNFYRLKPVRHKVHVSEVNYIHKFYANALAPDRLQAASNGAVLAVIICVVEGITRNSLEQFIERTDSPTAHFFVGNNVN